MSRSPFSMNAVVKIIYPARKRKGKRTLVKSLHTFQAAVAYAKKTAARSTTTALMGNWRDNVVACAYNLRDWKQAPQCFSIRPAESRKHPGSYLRGDRRLRRVPAALSGFTARHRRRRRRRQ